VYVCWPQDTIYAGDTVLQFLREGELQSIRKLALEVKDPAYFVHYNLDVLKQMQPNLTMLELRVEQGVMMSWEAGRNYLQKIVDEIRYATELDPEWVWPEVNVIDGKTGTFFEQIPGYTGEE
jgi:hypothetical protein